MTEAVTLADVRRAAQRIAPYVHRTPVLTSQAIDALCGAKVFFKCENLQKVGAFKIRGATNAILSLSDADAERGVCTHSSGNHAAAVAQAARWRGIEATVVMPENASEVKKRAVAGYGARIVYCGVQAESRDEVVGAVMQETGAVFIHPYDDPRVIAGQGTTALEFHEQVENLDILVAPVGGGGQLAGAALTTAAVRPEAKVIGAEPEQVNDAWLSMKEGRIVPATGRVTFADGLLTALGEHTFAVIRNHVAEIITVSEAQIVSAMRLIWERMKLIVEPSSAVALAAVLKHADQFAAQNVGIILTGGNVDLDHLPWLLSGVTPEAS